MGALNVKSVEACMYVHIDSATGELAASGCICVCSRSLLLTTVVNLAVELAISVAYEMYVFSGESLQLPAYACPCPWRACGLHGQGCSPLASCVTVVLNATSCKPYAHVSAGKVLELVYALRMLSTLCSDQAVLRLLRLSCSRSCVRRIIPPS